MNAQSPLPSEGARPDTEPETLPQSGGAWVRLPDGSLVPDTPPEAPAQPPVKER